MLNNADKSHKGLSLKALHAMSAIIAAVMRRHCRGNPRQRCGWLAKARPAHKMWRDKGTEGH
jgi:hypothetical protein